MFHRKTPRLCVVAVAALAVAGAAIPTASATAQRADTTPATRPAVTPHPPDSARRSPRRSRFGRFERLFDKTASIGAVP